LLLSLEEGNLRELYELRRMLEGEAAALAAARRSDEDLASMAAAVEDMAQGLDDRDAYASADVRFHVAVAAATGNRVALHAMHAIRELLERALEQVYGIPGSATRSLEQHREILGAIRAGDAEEARGRMRRHLTRVEQEIHDAVKTSRLADFSTPPPLDVKE
jgi:GntR family transcriptional repressor for pyruvate dehydrogenase complex